MSEVRELATLEAAVDEAEERLAALQGEAAALKGGLEEFSIDAIRAQRQRLDEIPLELIAARLELLEAELQVIEAENPARAAERERVVTVIREREAAVKEAKRLLLEAQVQHSRL